MIFEEGNALKGLPYPDETFDIVYCSQLFGHLPPPGLPLRALAEMREGDPFRQSWLDAGITEDEIQETLRAVRKWAEMEDAWFAALQCEMLASP